jgi:hypothetical protein
MRLQAGHCSLSSVPKNENSVLVMNTKREKKNKSNLSKAKQYKRTNSRMQFIIPSTETITHSRHILALDASRDLGEVNLGAVAVDEVLLLLRGKQGAE